MADFYISPATRAKYRPSADAMNISMDFNASPNGGARGTEVIIPNNASPSVRAAADKYNQLVAGFANKYGITDYPVRGVRTRTENKRGVPHTIHAEPFFNDDEAMQRAVQENPAEFAELYRAAFGGVPNARLIAPHGVGKDRGASSSFFGDETSYGELMANSLLGQSPQATTGTQGAAPMMQQEQQPRGLLDGFGIQKMQEGAEGETGQRFYQRDSFKDTAALLAQGFGRMGIMGMEEIADGIAKQRTESKARNKTLEYLRGLPNGEELVKLAEIAGPKAVASHLMKQQFGGGGDANVQSSQSLPDQSGVIMTMRDGSIAVKTIGGETLTGQQALDFARTANETYTAQQRDIYGARREGTLGADVELGAAAEAAKKSGGLTIERGFEAYDNAVKAGSALTTMDNAIAAIDDGAKSGVIYNMMPNVTESSAALGTAMNQMGLDVISSVTFGALSEGEMKLAMETAVPRNLGPEELRSYLVEKRDAQAKAREALMAAARYLTQPGNTISGWLDQQAQSDPPPSAISPQGRTYNPETGKFE